MSRLCRHHRVFSEKDRVRFQHVSVGAVFLCRGHKWIKAATGYASTFDRLISANISPYQRVVVTRESGIAKMSASASDTQVAP